MKINLKLSPSEKKSLSYLSKNVDLTLPMCYSYVQYFKLFNTLMTQHTIIENTELVLHGHCYDTDELNSYWLTLTKDLELLDFSVPISFDINKPDPYWEQISTKHQNIIKNVLKL